MSRSTPKATPPASATTVDPYPRALNQYHIFVTSPGDVNDERKEARAFFDAYNLNYAESCGLRFEIVDWKKLLQH